MAALQCDICGGRLMGRPGGIFECDSCGMTYDTAWAKAKIQEIKGTVKVEGTVEVTGTVKLDGPVKVEGGVNIENLLKRGWIALEDGHFEEAKASFDQVLQLDPESGQAYFGMAMATVEYRTIPALAKAYDMRFRSYIERARQYPDSKTAAMLLEYDSLKAAHQEAKEVPQNRWHCGPVRKSSQHRPH